jgi:hypothetical protein
MPLVVFEPTISVFEWSKTVNALDRAVTVTGITNCQLYIFTQFREEGGILGGRNRQCSYSGATAALVRSG